MPGDDEKVVGYFGFVPPANAICDGDACIIAGSEASFKKYLEVANPPNAGKVVIKKTRFHEILRGLSLGGPYSFDAEAYGRFYPLAKKAGLDIPEANFGLKPDAGVEFMTIRTKGSA
jgi:hypothetical protein